MWGRSIHHSSEDNAPSFSLTLQSVILQLSRGISDHKIMAGALATHCKIHFSLLGMIMCHKKIIAQHECVQILGVKSNGGLKLYTICTQFVKHVNKMCTGIHFSADNVKKVEG